MRELLALRPQVPPVRGVRLHLEGDPFRDLDPVPLELGDLPRIVRHQADAADAEDPQHRRRELVWPRGGGEAEGLVRLDRVESVVLEVVRGDLVRDPNPPPFLGEVEEDAPRGLADPPEGRVELLPAIAPPGAEDVPREALRVDADEDVPGPRDAPLDESDVLPLLPASCETHDPEASIAGREPRAVHEDQLGPILNGGRHEWGPNREA